MLVKPSVLISVVVPTFNNVNTIEETIESILRQDYPHFELIVSDHSSTDETYNKLLQYVSDPRFVLYKISRGGGAQQNWNAVTQKANGKFIRLVCGDDLLAPTSLSEHAEVILNHPEINFVASKRRIIDSAGRQLFSSRGLPTLVGVIEGSEAIRKSVRAGSNIFGEPACVTIRKSSLDAVGGWVTDEEYLLDQATYTKILQNSKMYALNKSLATFRVSTNQWSFRLARVQASQVAKFHKKLSGEFPGLLSKRDVFIGNLNAIINQLKRQVLYLALKISVRFQ